MLFIVLNVYNKGSFIFCLTIVPQTLITKFRPRKTAGLH